MNPGISVIVPAYNSARTLKACLESLLIAARTLENAEIIVVDDGSRDDTQLIASACNITVERLAQNRGPAAARNHGASIAQGDILMFIDADVAVAPDALSRAAEHFAGEPDCIAVIGSYDLDPGNDELISTYRNLLHHYVHQQTSASASHFWTGLGAIRRRVFESLGGFDEARYGRALEDIELGYRLRKLGYPITLDRAIQGKHLKHWTLLSMIRTDLLTRAIPWTHLLLEHRQIPGDFSLGWSQRLSVALAWLIVLFGLAGLFNPAAGYAALLALAGFVVINRGFLAFTARHRGMLFGILCAPLHILYNFNAGLGFIMGMVSYYLSRLTATFTRTRHSDI